jgi:hypothetical protein
MQYNGLPDITKRSDTIGTHYFDDPETWTTLEDSTWELKPNAGEAIEIQSAQIDFSEDINTPKTGNAIIVKFWSNNIQQPLKTVYYHNLKDWITRSYKKTKTELNTGGVITGSILQLDLDFAPPQPIIWSSAGLDIFGIPKINRMTVHLENHTPYKKLSNPNENAELARARYFTSVYEDPDYE